MSVLTQENLRRLLSYDFESGRFTWLRGSSRSPVGGRAGCLSNGYLVIRVDGVLRRAHRLAWLYVHGYWPTDDIDHINGDRTDNRIANLRCVTRGQNHQNRRCANTNSASGLLGVHPWRHKWRARIQVDGCSRHLGVFDSIDQAQAAYLSAKLQLHPFQTIV